MTFKRKVQFVLVGFAIGLMAVTLFAVRWAGLNAVREKVAYDFDKTRVIIEQQGKAQVAALDDALTTGLGDPLFRSQLGQASAADDNGLDDTQPSLTEPHEVFSSAEIPLMRRFSGFAVFNAEGLLVFSKASPKRLGDDFSQLPRALAVWDHGDERLVPAGGPYLVLTREVRSGNRVFGSVLIAESLETFVDQLQRAADATVEVVPKESARSLTAVTQRDDYLTVASDFQGIAQVLLSRSTAADMSRLTRRLDIALMIALLIAIVVSWPVASVLARRLTLQLSGLENAARQLERGDFSAHAPVIGDDEVGRVARAFNEMMVTLRERSFDRLTGTHNRRYFLNALDAALLRSDALGAPLSLVLIDVDHFRGYNETHGREAGDALLQDLARRAHLHCRRDDVLARYADDEFMLLLQDTDQQAAEAVAQSLVEQGHITACVVTRSATLSASHDLLRAADRAIYDAKAGARGRTVIAA